jgi:hypothetical protein
MSSSACWGQTQRRSVLGSPPTTSPTSPSRTAETDRWAGGVHGEVHRNVPLWTARPPGRPGDDLRQQPLHDRHRPWVCDDSGGHGPRDAMTPRGSATFVWPLRQAAPNRSQHRATAAPTISGARGLTNSRRRDASSTRSWPFYAKSSAWTSSLAIDNC